MWQPGCILTDVVLVCRARMVAPIARKGVAPFLPDDVPEDLPSKSITLKSGITISSGRYQALKCNFQASHFHGPWLKLKSVWFVSWVFNICKLKMNDNQRLKITDSPTIRNAYILSFDLHSFYVQLYLIVKYMYLIGLDTFPGAKYTYFN